MVVNLRAANFEGPFKLTWKSSSLFLFLFFCLLRPMPFSSPDSGTKLRIIISQNKRATKKSVIYFDLNKFRFPPRLISWSRENLWEEKQCFKKKEKKIPFFCSLPYEPAPTPSRFCVFVPLSPILNLFFFSFCASYDKITLSGFIFDDLSMSHDYVVLILHASLVHTLPILFIPIRYFHNGKKFTFRSLSYFYFCLFDIRSWDR